MPQTQDLHVLVLARRVAVVVQKSVGIRRLHHLHQYRRELPFQGQKALREGSGRHLDAAFVGGVDFEVVAVGGVETQQPEPLGARIFTCGETESMLIEIERAPTNSDDKESPLAFVFGDTADLNEEERTWE